LKQVGVKNEEYIKTIAGLRKQLIGTEEAAIEAKQKIEDK
jgi:hypothetical protein